MGTDATDTLRWKLSEGPAATLVTFELPGDLLSPDQLGRIELPAEARQRQHLGLILSGRGPVWLYAHLVHLAHPFAWVATHDPRLGGAVVVARHRQDAPEPGAVVELPSGDGPAVGL